MSKKTLRKLQYAQLGILIDIDKICKENNLKYYLIGGTLLGAVRHKGFIPWDDDVDIVMFRKDYNKLCQIMKSNKELKEKYFVQNFDSDPKYARYIMKIRLNGTRQIEEGVLDTANQGVYIDIFPLDYIKSRGLSAYIKGGLLRGLYAYKNIMHFRHQYHGAKRLFSNILFLVFKFLPEKKINHLFDVICTADNNKNCEYVTNYSSRFKWKKQTFPIRYYGKGTLLEFEDYMFNAPRKYKLILRRLYGDYMKLPPKNKRVAHELVEIDFGSYDMELEKKFLNEEEALR